MAGWPGLQVTHRASVRFRCFRPVKPSALFCHLLTHARRPADMTLEAGVIAARSTTPARRWSFGPGIEEGGVRFRIWAPKHRQIGLVIEGRDETVPMTPLADGWHETLCADARAGTLYRFELPDGLRVPDPASRHQPQDVHGPSEVVDPETFRWSDEGWQGLPEAELVIYELHLGTFTQEGTFRAAI